MCAKPNEMLKSIGIPYKLYHCSVCGCEVMASGGMIDRLDNQGWEAMCNPCCISIAGLEQELGGGPQFKVLPEVMEQLTKLGMTERQVYNIVDMIQKEIDAS